MKRLVAFGAAAAAAVCVATTPAWGATSAAAPTGTDKPQASVAKSKSGSYIVVLKADPLVKTMGRQNLNSSTAKQRKAALRATHDAVLKSAGISTAKKTSDYTNAVNGFAVRTDLKGAQRIAKDAKVAVVLPDELRQVTKADDDGGVAASAAAAAQANAKKAGPNGVAKNGLNNFLGLTAKGEAYKKGITGKGVVVGVIDTGIWPEHPSFAARPDLPKAPTLDASVGNTCNFGNTTWNKDDKKFKCNNKLIGAREFLDTYKTATGLEPYEFDSARDNEGHGTHTASTAAGNPNVSASIFGVDKGAVSGIAPDAQVIMYKALGDLGGYTSDLAGAIDQAVADHVDVINYSIGGGAQTVSPDTISFLFAADAGVFAAISAGNDGPGAKTVGGPADVPWVTAVGATTYPTFYSGAIQLGNGKEVIGGSVTKGVGPSLMVDAAKAGVAGAETPDLCITGSLDKKKVKGKIVLCGRGVNGRIEKSAEVKRAGGVGMILYNQNNVDNIFTDNFFVPTVMIDKRDANPIINYVNSVAFPMGQLVKGKVTSAPYPTPSVAYFSSRGENATAGDIIKPDIAAPGVQIMAGNTPKPSPGTQPAGELFQAIAGTSMASPVVAGTYALLKQAHPDWSPAAAKSALMTTSDPNVLDNNRTSVAGPFATGSGLALLGRPGDQGTALNPGLVYDADINDYLGFLCAEGPEAFTNPDATCASLKSAGVSTTATDLNYPSIGIEAAPGIQQVTRTLTNVTNKQIRVSAVVKAPAGYAVKVSPTVLTVQAGQSASYTVTFTNRNAPIGAWRAGSLTWTGDGYSVRSPLEVKGVSVKAPAEVTGTGTSGSATLPVTVGKAGTYTATPHGLVAAEHHNDVVSQDPDQTYPSADDGAGVVKVPYTLSGVDVAQWKLTVPDPTDLDMYLLGPDGKQVAASTNGGTNEEITLQAPADGTYTMVVHGWAVPTANTAFDLRSWLVPNTTGGSLTVTSGSPTTTTVGQQLSVGIAWSGLTAGEEYLGSVTHEIDGTTQGRSVVAVTG